MASNRTNSLKHQVADLRKQVEDLRARMNPRPIVRVIVNDGDDAEAAIQGECRLHGYDRSQVFAIVRTVMPQPVVQEVLPPGVGSSGRLKATKIVRPSGDGLEEFEPEPEEPKRLNGSNVRWRINYPKNALGS
jgi:hypothetical protein